MRFTQQLRKRKRNQNATLVHYDGCVFRFRLYNHDSQRFDRQQVIKPEGSNALPIHKESILDYKELLKAYMTAVFAIADGDFLGSLSKNFLTSDQHAELTRLSDELDREGKFGENIVTAGV
jgi:hypothetical protein